MLDARQEAAPAAIHLKDYRVPPFLIDAVDLIFDLGEDATTVRARLALRRNPASEDAVADLRLDGEALTLTRLALDGEELGPNRYAVDAESLVVTHVPDAFDLDIETRIEPQNNTELSGLYKSGGNFCTQCEAEGFRRITYFLDRPDIMARYTTTILAERRHYPVLLSNGNPVDRGEIGERHWVKWEDPHPKPSYLFALVAGDLVALKDAFTTASGRKVDLGIWVRRGDEDKCGHAMDSLKRAMRWDEEVFGLEYDLDIFNIVAVSDFNMGAMENKGLNVFNTKYILAKPETATDFDYEGVESVVAHEYFHNWTGNRVTCRDWFQLSLKEGLTVFRDQEFSADQNSRAVKRILDVRRLRATQFPEDAGPLAHPVRPESYIEINNFYTATVYQKGAEVVRMIHTLLGKDGFRKGMDLYFERHDNQAVRIEDFAQAMQDASGVDLSRFRRWYAQAGTPELTVAEDWDAASGTYALTLSQTTAPTPGQPEKEPFVIPVATGLLDGETGAERAETRVLILDEASKTFRFDGLKAKPVPSLLRGYSAPVKLAGLDAGTLRFLAIHDTDPFARWEAGQQVGTQYLLALVGDHRAGRPLVLPETLAEVFEAVLATAGRDPAFTAEALLLPGEAFLADQMKTADVEAIHAAREFTRRALGRRFKARLAGLYRDMAVSGPYRPDGESIGRRSLRNVTLGYLAAADAEGLALAERQFEAQANMTEVLAALGQLVNSASPARDAALAAFYDKWQAEELVVDKWFALQAGSSRADTLDRVKELTRHPAFDIKNPNRARALIAGFSMANQLRFHAADGSGYAFLADAVIELDQINGQIAARMVAPLGAWRRQDETRQKRMKAALERVLATPNLSKGTYEMTSRSLA